MLQFIVHSSDAPLLEAGIRHLHAAAFGPELREQIGARGGVGIALDVFAESSLGEGVRLAAVLLLAQLCAGSPGNCKRFRKADVRARVDAQRAEFCLRPAVSVSTAVCNLHISQGALTFELAKSLTGRASTSSRGESTHNTPHAHVVAPA